MIRGVFTRIWQLAPLSAAKLKENGMQVTVDDKICYVARFTTSQRVIVEYEPGIYVVAVWRSGTPGTWEADGTTANSEERAWIEARAAQDGTLDTSTLTESAPDADK